MKKIIVTVSLLAGLSAAYGTPEDDALQAKRMEWSRAHLEKQGGPVPDGGVKVIPAEQMASYKENKSTILKIKNDMAKYGYIKENSQAEQLLNLKIVSVHDFKKHGDNYDPHNTHLKHSIDEIKMAYTFVGVSSNEITESIGYAPAVTYIKGEGWAGAAHFFIKDGIGNCSYSENNTKLSHGAVIIPKENARYDVNGKTTTVIVRGTPESGFLYNIDWYDATFFRQLSCANKSFDPKITEGIIELAKHIDTYNSAS
jgi:hypothetical protein